MHSFTLPSAIYENVYFPFGVIDLLDFFGEWLEKNGISVFHCLSLLRFSIGLLVLFSPYLKKLLYIRKVRSSLVIWVGNIFILHSHLFFDLLGMAFDTKVLFLCIWIYQYFLLWLLDLTHCWKGQLYSNIVKRASCFSSRAWVLFIVCLQIFYPFGIFPGVRYEFSP